MFCNYCGTTCDEDAKFCPACGAKVNASAPTQPVYQQPVYQQPVYQQPVYQQPVYQQPVYQQPIYQQPYFIAPVVPGRGLGIASLILGISSISMMSFVTAIVGIVLGSVAIGKAKRVGMKNGFAVAGLTCSIIAICVVIVAVVLYIAAFAAYGFQMIEGYGGYI